LWSFKEKAFEAIPFCQKEKSTPIPAFAPEDGPDDGAAVFDGEVLEVGRSVACQLICINGASNVYDGMAAVDIVAGIVR
jgi:hypothetical protein